jgi:hypothetical protein
MNDFAIDDHFTGRAANVRATYDALLDASAQLGPFEEQAKKTSIHLARRSAFAGVATQKEALILTIKCNAPVRDARVRRIEQTSSSRWHIELKLTTPADVDAQLRQWLAAAYEISA